MGRLVDIEDVKDFINGLDSLPWEEEVDDLVKTIPTAYDVEKVVAELEEESDFFGGEPMGSLQKAYYCKGVEKAIDIVKAGGVE